jgi:DNA-binding transcriptional LysR family regulator
MQDLNDIYLFAAVVNHSGFSAAARALDMPKSRLSKHVARLEERLGVRLLERSTRKLRVTEIGQTFFEKCQAVLAGVEAAEAVIADARSEPKGIVRVACPIGLTQNMLASVLPGFAKRYPLVRIQITAINRRVDLVEEQFDVAFRVRTRLDTDPNLTMRVLGQSRAVLAASPGFLAECREPPTIATLNQFPTLSMLDQMKRETWELVGPDGRTAEIVHEPRISSGDFNLLRAAAVAGLGIALLPDHVCNGPFRSGELIHLLPEWRAPEGTAHLVFTTRQGLLPAVRAFIDHVAQEFPSTIQACRDHGK